MTPEAYAALQAAITAATAQYVVQLGGFLIRPGMGVREWVQLLQVIYPEVEQRRTESATLARQFYDSQRTEQLPELPRNDRPLEGTSFETFVRSMEPARKKVIQASQEGPVNLDTPPEKILSRLKNPRQSDAAVTHLALQTIREVENAGRRQVLHAVEEDRGLDDLIQVVRDSGINLLPSEPAPEPTILNYKGEPVKYRNGLVRGWARVATGRETCAWCLMLISRGPVYLGADTAGLNISDRDAIDMVAAGEDVGDYMDEWHTGCDCKVVPVFKISEWSGRDAWKRAEDLWNEATAEARDVLKANPDKVYLTGKNKGQRVTLNTEAQNALRRRLERGDIDMSEFAAFAA